MSEQQTIELKSTINNTEYTAIYSIADIKNIYSALGLNINAQEAKSPAATEILNKIPAAATKILNQIPAAGDDVKGAPHFNYQDEADDYYRKIKETEEKEKQIRKDMEKKELVRQEKEKAARGYKIITKTLDTQISKYMDSMKGGGGKNEEMIAASKIAASDVIVDVSDSENEDGSVRDSGSEDESVSGSEDGSVSKDGDGSVSKDDDGSVSDNTPQAKDLYKFTTNADYSNLKSDVGQNTKINENVKFILQRYYSLKEEEERVAVMEKGYNTSKKNEGKEKTYNQIKETYNNIQKLLYDGDNNEIWETKYDEIANADDNFKETVYPYLEEYFKAIEGRYKNFQKNPYYSVRGKDGPFQTKTFGTGKKNIPTRIVNGELVKGGTLKKNKNRKNATRKK